MKQHERQIILKACFILYLLLSGIYLILSNVRSPYLPKLLI